MLNSFSWSEFFSVIAIATLIYYAVTAIIMFRHDIRDWVKRISSSSSSSSSQRQNAQEQDALMGEARYATRPTDEATQDVTATHFSPNQPQEAEEADDFYTQDEAAYQASISNLLNELNALLNDLPPDKEQALEQLQTLLQRYAHLHQADRKQVTDYITAALDHHTQLVVSEQEINTSWPKLES